MTSVMAGLHTTVCMTDTLSGALNTEAYECNALCDHVADGTRNARAQDDLSPEWHRACLEERFGRNSLFNAVTRAHFF